jgi:hypothetical protein
VLEQASIGHNAKHVGEDNFALGDVEVNSSVRGVPLNQPFFNY